MDATPTSSQPARAAGPQAEGEESRLGLLALCALALVVGVATGFGAVLLRDLIGLVHNAFYNGVLSYHYDANRLEAPSRFGAFVALSPILGGLVASTPDGHRRLDLSLDELLRLREGEVRELLRG